MGISGFPSQIGFNPSRYKKPNFEIVNSTLTKNSYVSVLNYTSGRGMLGDINFKWNNNSSNENKQVELRVTLDGIVVAATRLNYVPPSNTTYSPSFGLGYRHNLAYNNSNDRLILLVSGTSRQFNPTAYESMNVYTDGTAQTLSGTASAVQSRYLYLFREPIYFKQSLLVEVYTNSATGTGATTGVVEYYTEE